MAAVAIRGTTYPVVLPKLKDPRLHLAATITSLQVLGQVAFHFRLSIVQILVCLVTCGVIEVAVTLRTQRVIMWPASALLTGNGVAFVLRLPGNVHGEWWSFRGWWIYAATAGGALVSKYVIKWRGEHIFNPSNIGLVAVFLLLGRTRVEPLDFWWGPMSWWMVLALAIIVTAGFTILSRLKLLRIALGFWASFALGIGGLALAGHVMTARWHLGPITGFYFWWVLVTSPEVLVFLFFMITDPKTAPRDLRARLVYAVTLGVLAAALIAPTRTEFAAKVALLSALAIVCVGKTVLESLPLRVDRTRLALAAAAGLAVYAGVVVFAGGPSASLAAQPLPAGKLPPITILPSPGVQTPLDEPTAQLIAHDLLAVEPASTADRISIHLVPGTDQNPPSAVAQLAGRTFRLEQTGNGDWAVSSATQPKPVLAIAPKSSALAAEHLTNVAATVGLDFQQGAFHFGVSNDVESMMGGGVCWLDYNGDGWEDLFAVNSYSSADTAQWEAHGGLPTTELFENDHGIFQNVTAKAHANLAVQGDGCAAADLNGDGRPDLVVTTTQGVKLLWNEGGTFREQTLAGSGWYTGAAVADVNGDGRPDIFVAGYSDPSEPVPGSLAGFPTNLTGVRDLLYLNEGSGRFREVGVQAGLESASFRHGLGAQFVDYNHDGRPDLYVANDEDPNELYENVPWPGGAKADPAGLGFRFEERAGDEGVADPFAGMGIATSEAGNGLGLFVTNSRGEPSAAYSQQGATFESARPDFDPALGTGFAGWGASWVDLANSGTPDLVLAAGAIPVTNLAKNAEAVRVLAPDGSRYGNAKKLMSLNGRGVAAADADNNGRMEVAINTIGGKLVLLQPTGPSGNWVDVSLSRFVPGAVVTVTTPGGRTQTRTVAAGSSYLSSEDPRLHFGLGSATTVSSLTVRYPWGAVTHLTNVRAGRIVQVAVPAAKPVQSLATRTPDVATCTRPPVYGSLAIFWDAVATRILKLGTASQPVEARDLFDLSTAMLAAYRATTTPAARATAISYASYRLLLWRASYDVNLDQTFATLSQALGSLCYSQDYVSTTGGSPAAIGNRIAAAAIRAGMHDGSNEQIHYADPAYTPENAPLIVAQPGTTVHDPTFWQPLALAQIAPNGLAGVPAKIQTFADAQWGGVRTFAGRVKTGPPPFSDPSSAAYKAAAIAVLRATAAPSAHRLDTSPLKWNELVQPTGTLAGDLQLLHVLNGALNDAAVSVWAAKRTYQAPRPISMIRYLAFNGQLPIVAGVSKLVGGKTYVFSQGRWILGANWTPPAQTPASPGWVSEGSAFAAAASTVLTALTHHSYAAADASASSAGLREGIETPADEADGHAVGVKVAKLALAKRP
ncbi:MAG TPA: FG-GAP-like repeat-containing protein [Gaiellaceae bacterium]|nr:FG-GAP-like repeat-containing protein [Gaiellaceae bacterium]